jgi:hypothetical protein
MLHMDAGVSPEELQEFRRVMARWFGRVWFNLGSRLHFRAMAGAKKTADREDH